VVTDEHPAGAGFGAAALAMLAASRDNPDISLAPVQMARPVSFTVAFAMNPPRIGPNLMGPARHVEPPAWREMPSDTDIYLAYPLRAANAHMAGVAGLNCAVHVSGALYDCKVASEAPTGEGFGAHALSLVDRVLMSPLKCDGQPVEGARVVVPIRFKPPPRIFRPH
jgi:TonB family protein